MNPSTKLGSGSRPLIWMARAAFVVCLGGVLVLALNPHQIDGAVPGRDKAEHLIAFLVLAGLGRFSWPRAPFLVGVGLLALGGAIELAQGTALISRDISFSDWVADACGVAMGLAVASAVSHVSRPFCRSRSMP